jgi:hypothetical protein
MRMSSRAKMALFVLVTALLPECYEVAVRRSFGQWWVHGFIGGAFVRTFYYRRHFQKKSSRTSR